MRTSTNVDLADPATSSRRLLWAAIFLGLGMGGFFDGIVLHQILQWHHLLTSAGYPADSVANLQINILADGLFHAATYVLTAIGIVLLWTAGRDIFERLSGKLLAGGFLIGWGTFNLVEGIVNHQILGIHHVNETVPPDQWIYWDLGFLVWGAVMIVGGLALKAASDRETDRA
jgi:uncharacterized membrane protein